MLSWAASCKSCECAAAGRVHTAVRHTDMLNVSCWWFSYFKGNERSEVILSRMICQLTYNKLCIPVAALTFTTGISCCSLHGLQLIQNVLRVLRMEPCCLFSQLETNRENVSYVWMFLIIYYSESSYSLLCTSCSSFHLVDFFYSSW